MAANQPISQPTGQAIQVGAVAPRGGKAAIHVVLAALIGLHLFVCAALSVMGLGASDVSNLHAFLWLGTMVFQPGLVACWFALGTDRIFFRLATLAILMASFAVADLWGASWNQGETFEPHDFSNGVFFPAACLTLSLLLWMLPRRYWRLSNPLVEDVAIAAEPPRAAFTMTHMMGFLTAASLPLTLFGYLARRVTMIDSTGWLASLAGGFVAGVVVALLSAPLLIALLGALLATRHRRRFVMALLAIYMLLAVAAVGIAFAIGEEPSNTIQFLLIFVGYGAAGTISFWVLHSCGYRLTKKQPTEVELDLTARNVTLGFRSAGRPLCVLGLLFVVLLFPAWHLVKFRREQEVEFAWRRRGVSVLVTDGQVTYARMLKRGTQNRVVSNELLEELSRMPRVNNLDFSGSAITDGQLELLGDAPSLETLDLSGTPISDAGIEHLAKLVKLKWLTLTGTRVTPAGFQQLRAALPDCVVQPGARPPAPPSSVTVPARTRVLVGSSDDPRK